MLLCSVSYCQASAIIPNNRLGWKACHGHALAYLPPPSATKKTGFYTLPSDKTIRTETALIYDAVQLFGKALTDLDRSQVTVTSTINILRLSYNDHHE